MSVTLALLIISALAPAVILCIYIFIMDRKEKEPISLLLKLIIFGALGVIPVVIIGSLLDNITDSIFSPFIVPGGFKPPMMKYVYNFIHYFIVVALVEEGVKCFITHAHTKKHPEFDSLFDGIIYAVFVSLGFAALENVLYVTSYGFGNAILRAVLSVPGHMFYGVMMGYYYSLIHIADKAAQYEQNFIEQGLITDEHAGFPTKSLKIKCLLVPTLAHGLYDFLCVLGTTLSILLLFAFVIYMYIHCFKKIIRMSKADKSDTDCIAQLLFRKYPDLPDKLMENE